MTVPQPRKVYTKEDVTVSFVRAEEEVEEKIHVVEVGDVIFPISFHNQGGSILNWLEAGTSLEAIPRLLMAIMDDDDYARLKVGNVDWDEEVQPFALWLIERLGGGDEGN